MRKLIIAAIALAFSTPTLAQELWGGMYRNQPMSEIRAKYPNETKTKKSKSNVEKYVVDDVVIIGECKGRITFMFDQYDQMGLIELEPTSPMSICYDSIMDELVRLHTKESIEKSGISFMHGRNKSERYRRTYTIAKFGEPTRTDGWWYPDIAPRPEISPPNAPEPPLRWRRYPYRF